MTKLLTKTMCCRTNFSLEIFVIHRRNIENPKAIRLGFVARTERDSHLKNTEKSDIHCAPGVLRWTLLFTPNRKGGHSHASLWSLVEERVGNCWFFYSLICFAYGCRGKFCSSIDMRNTLKILARKCRKPYRNQHSSSGSPGHKPMP